MLSRKLNPLGLLKRCYSLQVSPEPLQAFRTPENNPLKHSKNDLARYYTVNPEVIKTLFSHRGLPKTYAELIKSFTETCFMVREPTLEIIELMKQTDYSKPVNRFVMYGEKGTGKTISMAHLLHYASEDGQLIVHIPWVTEWLRRVTIHKEMTNSVTREGFIDLPLDAAAWLLHFKLQNNKLLQSTNLCTSKEYVWSKREITPAGSPLLDLVDLGYNRVKYASDIIVTLMEEIKILSSQNKCRTFVAIDGFNCFYYPMTLLKTLMKRKVPPNEVTLTLAAMEITKNDWNNGTVVVTVDKQAVPEDMQLSHYPRYLLTKQGFEHLDPFIPVLYNNYTEKEFISCLQYYRDRLWLRSPHEVDRELAFLSNYNPYVLMKICTPL